MGPPLLRLYQTNENGQRVAEALLTLEPLHREVLVLRFHEELSLEEIAQVTRSPLSTVKSRLYRGLSALKPRISRPGGRGSDERETKQGALSGRPADVARSIAWPDCDANLAAGAKDPPCGA